MSKRKEYIVYDTVTDLPVCIGNIAECAFAIGVTTNALKCATTRYFKGERCGRYVLYDLQKVIEGGYLEDGEYCED